MPTFAVLMYADPAQTEAMTDDALFDVEQKHAALRKELGQTGELTGGAGLELPHATLTLSLGPEQVEHGEGPLAANADIHLTAYYEIETETLERAQEIAAKVLDDHVTAVELRRIHSVAG